MKAELGNLEFNGATTLCVVVAVPQGAMNCLGLQTSNDTAVSNWSVVLVYWHGTYVQMYLLMKGCAL